MKLSKMSVTKNVLSMAAAAIVLAITSTSHALEFKLNCADNQDRILPVTVVKIATRGANGKWQNTYAVETAEGRFPLAPSGNGDEDYSDYRVVSGTAGLSKITGASVQNQFRWVSLINNQGSSFASCRK